MTTEPADAIATIRQLRTQVALLEAGLAQTLQREADANAAAFKHMARADAAEDEAMRLRNQIREAALDALAAYGQAADAYAAQLAAEAAITRAWEMGRDAAADTAFKAVYKYPLRTMLTNTDNATMIELSILALTPPADLIERAKGGAP